MDPQKKDNSPHRPGSVIEPKPSTLEKIEKVVSGEAPQFKSEQTEALKFTGFEQPKETGLWFVMKRHKVKSALVSFSVIILVIVGALVLSSSGGTERTSQPQAAVQNEEQGAEDQEVEEVDEPITSLVPEVTMAQYSLSQDGEFYELYSDDQVWLTRSEHSWDESVSWGDWLYFASDLGSGVVGIESFNYVTKEYLTIAELTPPEGSSIMPMYVEGDFLYIQFDESVSNGATHRCVLDEQKSCSNMELFYRGSGKLTTLTSAKILVNYEFQKGAGQFQTLSIFDPAADAASTVVELSSSYGIGSELASVAEDDLLWIIEKSGDVAQAVDPNYDGRKLERLYAVDVNGDTKFVLPAAALPIVDAEFLRDGATGNITFVNDTNEVVFDVSTKQFGPVKDRTSTVEIPVEKTQIRKLLDISTRLEIPVDLTLRAVEQ